VGHGGRGGPAQLAAGVTALQTLNAETTAGVATLCAQCLEYTDRVRYNASKTRRWQRRNTLLDVVRALGGTAPQTCAAISPIALRACSAPTACTGRRVSSRTSLTVRLHCRCCSSRPSGRRTRRTSRCSALGASTWAPVSRSAHSRPHAVSAMRLLRYGAYRSTDLRAAHCQWHVMH